MEKLPESFGNILEQVKIAAQNSDIEALSKWTNTAKQCEKFIQEYSDLENRVRNFIGSLMPEKEIAPVIQLQNCGNTVIAESKISAKERGRIARDRWVEERASKGIKLYVLENITILKIICQLA